MSQVKLAAAKELIQEKRYTEARTVLLTMNNATAARWLEQLDRIAPQSVPPPTPHHNIAPPPPPPQYAMPLPLVTPEAERYYQAQNNQRKRRRLGSGFELILMGVSCIGLTLYLGSLPKLTISGRNPPNDTLSIVLVAVGVLLTILGLVVIRRRNH